MSPLDPLCNGLVSPELIVVTTTVCWPKQEIELLLQCFLLGTHFLQSNADLMADHCHILDVLRQHSQGAFLPVKEGDLFLFDPQPTVHEEMDPTCQSLVFQDSS